MLQEQLDAAEFRSICDALSNCLPKKATEMMDPKSYELWVKLIALTNRYGKAGIDGARQLIGAHTHES